MSVSASSTLTPEEFAQQIQVLRPHLIRLASFKTRCQQADAEDLVSDSIRRALLILPLFRAETGPDGLRKWMEGILKITIWQYREKRRERNAHECDALEDWEEAAATVPAPDPPSAERLLDEDINALPQKLRWLVHDWLEGASQVEIARWNHLHRNTVANRLHEAFARLGVSVPDADQLAYCGSLMRFCSYVTIYRRPTGVWRSWSQNHPPAVRFRLQ